MAKKADSKKKEKEDIKEKIIGDSVTLSINPKIYPLDVVLSSAYMFTDKYFVVVDGDPEKEILVEIRPKNAKEEVKNLGKEFSNELINYANYAVRAIQNQKLRESIIHRVLLTNSVEPILSQPEEVQDVSDVDDAFLDEEIEPWKEDDEDESWFDDPEGIAVPWEEKYGADDKKK